MRDLVVPPPVGVDGVEAWRRNFPAHGAVGQHRQVEPARVPADEAGPLVADELEELAQKLCLPAVGGAQGPDPLHGAVGGNPGQADRDDLLEGRLPRRAARMGAIGELHPGPGDEGLHPPRPSGPLGVRPVLPAPGQERA